MCCHTFVQWMVVHIHKGSYGLQMFFIGALNGPYLEFAKCRDLISPLRTLLLLCAACAVGIPSTRLDQAGIQRTAQTGRTALTMAVGYQTMLRYRVQVLLWSAFTARIFAGGRGRTQFATYDYNTGEVSGREVASTNHDMFCPGDARVQLIACVCSCCA